MSPNDMRKQLSSPRGAHASLVGNPPSVHDYAMFEEFSFVRREAQTEADLAYEDWRMDDSRDSYAIYRAAQDRADAAQDDLADWTRKLAA
jgi:hypothetical protein